MTESELMQLSEQVGLALKARGATVTTAESCTGGWVAKVITDIAGSSAWFERGFVTYSNEAKSANDRCTRRDAGAAWRGERICRGGNGDRRTESGSC